MTGVKTSQKYPIKFKAKESYQPQKKTTPRKPFKVKSINDRKGIQMTKEKHFTFPIKPINIKLMKTNNHTENPQKKFF